MTTATPQQTLTDQIIASDFLIDAKSAIQRYALALTETSSPQVRTLLRNQLDHAIALHEQITNFLSQKGWYNAYNIKQQVQQDIQSAQQAIKL